MCEMYDKLMADMKSAMKAKDMMAVNTIRGIIAKAKDLTVNAGKEMTDDAVLGVIAGAVLTAGAFWADLPLWATVPAFLVLLLSLGLTLPAAMTFALTLHRERAGAAAAVLGAVAFVSGGAAAPLTSARVSPPSARPLPTLSFSSSTMRWASLGPTPLAAVKAL